MSSLAHTATPQRSAPLAGFTQEPLPMARRWLARAAMTWLAVALVGQAMFSTYIVLLYGGATLRGDMARWNLLMPRGYVPGDTAANAAIMLHVLLAVVIMAIGAVQLLPVVRQRVPAAHRWLGRIYVVSVSLTSVAGAFMVWGRGTVGDASQHVAITLNAVILTGSALLAWRTARAKQFTDHRRWAVRAYIAANGVFFFRVSLFLWLAINRGPVGFDPKTFAGPFLTGLACWVYVLVPTLVVSAYFAAERARAAWAPRLAAIGLFTHALVMAAGIAAVSMILWIPAM